MVHDEPCKIEIFLIWTFLKFDLRSIFASRSKIFFEKLNNFYVEDFLKNDSFVILVPCFFEYRRFRLFWNYEHETGPFCYRTYPLLHHTFGIFWSENLYSLCSPGNKNNQKIIQFLIFSSKKVEIDNRKVIFLLELVLIKLIYFWLSNFDRRFPPFLMKKNKKINQFLIILVSCA